MKQTVLHKKHEALKARMTDFQGWQVPLFFSDAQNEYQAVRTAAGLFDIGYLGRIEVRGPGARAALQSVVTWNIDKIAEGSFHYGLICNESGFIVSDALIIHVAGSKASGDRYLLTVSPLNADKVLNLLNEQAAGGDVVVDDRSQTLAHLALQGPRSQEILSIVAGHGFKRFKPRAVKDMTLGGTSGLVSQSGYTGEHGFECIVPADGADSFWDAILDAGRDVGLLPCGFAARDILRLETGYLLYGSDIDETRTPIEAGLSAFVDFTKEFPAEKALRELKAKGTEQKLAGFMLLDKGVLKPGGSIFSENREIGSVTSGCQSPRLRKTIGLGYVFSRYAQAGQEIEIEVRDREIAARIVELPFYRKK